MPGHLPPIIAACMAAGESSSYIRKPWAYRSRVSSRREKQDFMGSPLEQASAMSF